MESLVRFATISMSIDKVYKLHRNFQSEEVAETKFFGSQLIVQDYV